MPALIPPFLHPLAVHVPIILIPGAAALATYAAWRRPAWAPSLVLVVMGLAAAGAFVADQLGDRDLEAAHGTLSPEARDVAEVHEDLGSVTWVSTAVLFVLPLVFRRRAFGPGWAWVLALAWWGLFALVAVTAWYGGALTYEYGVNAP